MATGPLKRADMCVSVTRTENYFSFVGDVEYLIYRPWSSFKITKKSFLQLMLSLLVTLWLQKMQN